MLFIYCCLNWLVCAISWLWFFLCFMIAFVMHGNTSTPKISFFGLLCTNYDQLSCLQHSLRVLGLDMQVYKQICKCQITEGDAETGGKSDTFSKKQNKRHTKKNNRIHFPAITFSPFWFFVFPWTVTSVIEEKTTVSAEDRKVWILLLSRRMLLHSTMRKFNSLLEEKILLLYWPAPKIPLNNPHCVHTHTQREQKNKTRATGIQVANLF